MDDAELIEKIDKLKEALQAGIKEDRIAAEPLKVQDQSELAQQYLSTSAQLDMQRKANTLIVREEDGRVFKSVYFAVSVRDENLEKGIQAIALALNDMSQQGLIHSTLASLSSLKLARMPGRAEMSVVFAFVLVPIEAEGHVKEKYSTISVEEGGISDKLDSDMIDLKDGEFYAAIHVTTSILSTESSVEEILQKTIDQYLAVLPKGTVVRSLNRCASLDLSIPFEVIFYNPLMQRVKSVDLEYMREVSRVDEKLEVFNLLTSVRYFDVNKQELFKH